MSFVRNTIAYDSIEVGTVGLPEGMKIQTWGLPMEDCKVMERGGVVTVIVRSKTTGKKYKGILKEFAKCEVTE